MNRNALLTEMTRIIAEDMSSSVHKHVHGQDSPNMAVNPAYRIMRLIESQKGDWDQIPETLVYPTVVVTQAERQMLLQPQMRQSER